MQKTLHFMWYQGLDKAPETLRDMPRRWARLNPEYEIKVWDEDSLFSFIAARFPQYLTFFEKIGFGEPSNVRIIKRCDFARLLILFAFGGAYVDLDCEPIRPIRTLFESGVVEHTFTHFEYSRDFSQPTILSEIAGEPIPTRFTQYEMIFSREHLPNDFTGKYTLANTVMFAQGGSPLINELIVRCITNVREKVLSFAGPHGLSKYLRERINDLAGRVLALPPYYFLWQKHDMGPPWEKTICCHLNKMDWVDQSKPIPWDI